MEFALKIIIAGWYKLLDNFYGSFHVFILDLISHSAFFGAGYGIRHKNSHRLLVYPAPSMPQD